MGLTWSQNGYESDYNGLYHCSAHLVDFRGNLLQVPLGTKACMITILGIAFGR
jgi:hypothetical protein